jgi:hypothetical protein
MARGPVLQGRAADIVQCHNGDCRRTPTTYRHSVITQPPDLEVAARELRVVDDAALMAHESLRTGRR